MPPRSKVKQLPAAVLSWLEQALTEGNFSGYEQLEAALKERGFQISKSALHRHGQTLERRLAAVRASTDAARMIAAAAPDEADQRSAAVISLVQTDIFNVLMLLQEAETAEPEERLRIMGNAARAVADLSRAAIGQKKHEAGVKAKLEARLSDLEAEASGKKPGARKLDAETLRIVRQEVYGLA